MISGAVARHLRDIGYDVLGVQEPQQEWARAFDDEGQLEIATSQQRVLVTFDVPDFGPTVQVWASLQRTHYGIVLIHPRTIPSNDVGGLIRALTRVLDTYQTDDALKDCVIFLGQ
jgi:hypothetical protein